MRRPLAAGAADRDERAARDIPARARLARDLLWRRRAEPVERRVEPVPDEAVGRDSGGRRRSRRIAERVVDVADAERRLRECQVVLERERRDQRVVVLGEQRERAGVVRLVVVRGDEQAVDDGLAEHVDRRHEQREVVIVVLDNDRAVEIHAVVVQYEYDEPSVTDMTKTSSPSSEYVIRGR